MQQQDELIIDDLTAEERAELAGCDNPDGTPTDRYKWDEELQREIIGLVLNDRTFALQCNGLIRNNYFANEAHQLFSKIAFTHFDKYKCLPNKTQLTQELKELVGKKDPKIQAFYFGELNSVLSYYVPGLETRDYYLDKITNFAKGMAMKFAFSKCLEEFKRAPEDDATWVKIETLVRDALAVDSNFDIGLDYFRSFEERYERMQQKIEKADFFITGFKEIDDALSGGGLSRGEIGSVVALPGVGKSLFLVNASLANMHRGKKVLYISLEIDQDKCAERFDAQFANPEPWGAEHNGITIKNLYDKKESVFASLREYVSDKDDSRLLVVKQFPSSQLSMAKFRAYFAQTKMLGFHPDLVIIDYIGEMEDYPGIPIHESRVRLVRDLRGFAVEEQVCVLTAMQPDGKSREQITLGGVIDDSNLAEAKGQNRPLDALWSINQLNEEKECGLARLFVIKHRDGKSRFTSHIEFNYDTLKMRGISKNKYESTMRKYKSERTETITEAVSKETQFDSIVKGRNKSKVKFTDKGYGDVEDAPEQLPESLQ